MRYFYVDPARVTGSRAELGGEEARHIVRVLRLRRGDTVHLLDGCGYAYEGEIREASVDRVVVAIHGRREVGAESPVAITVAQAMLKDRKMDRLVRQLTEIGVRRWIPFAAKRSVPRPAGAKIAGRVERWQKISIEAIKQCRRGRPMQIEPPMDFEEMLAAADGVDARLIFWEQQSPEGAGTGGDWPTSPQSCFLIVGPEGGFAGEEVRAALAAGFTPMSLGPRILRAETAVLTAAIVAQHRFGDLGEKIA